MTSRDANTPRSRPRTFAYSKRSFDTPGVRGPGIKVLKRLPGLEYVRPSWSGTETVIRIYPGLCPENPKEFDTFRVSEELGRYGNWQCCYEAVRKFGENSLTYLLHDGSDPHYNAYSMNPAWILYRAIKDACEKGTGRPEWFPLLQRSDKRGAPLAAPTEICLVQCALFRHNSKDYFGDGLPPFGGGSHDPTAIFELSKSAADQLFALFDAEHEDWKGDPDDPARFKHGDPVAIEDGVFVHIYEMGTDPRVQTRQANPYGRGAPQTKKQKGPFGYACHLTKTLDDGPDDLTASLVGQENMVRQKCRFWEDILEFMPDEEQAHLLNNEFPASAIMYAFRDHRDWILDDTRKRAVNSSSVAMPGAGDYNAYAQRAQWEPEQPLMPARVQTVNIHPQNDDWMDAKATVDHSKGKAPVLDVAVPDGSIPDEDESDESPTEVVKPTKTDVKAEQTVQLQAARERVASRMKHTR